MTTDVLAGETRTLSLEDIEVTDRNPRKSFDEDALKSLARSIREKGLLQPILVRPVGENGGEEAFELVSGERRLRAHRRIGAETIRAEIRELTAQEAAELRLVENIEREDLHAMEEAAAYRELLEGEEWHVEDIADQVGRSESYVYSRLKLLDLVDEAREAFLEEGPISFGHARLIARLDEEEQKKATRAVTHHVFGFRGGQHRDGPLSVQGLREWVEDHLHLNLEHAPFSMDDDELYPEMGACSDCPFRSGSQPALFADVDEPNICTKPTCYETKVERTIRRKIDQLREEGVEPLVGIATGHRAPSEDDWEAFDRILALGSWQCGATRITDDNRCGSEIRGVCIGGSESGEFIEICLGEDCEEHATASTSTQSEPDPFKQWTRTFRGERRRWREVFNALVARCAISLRPDLLSDEEALRTVCLRLFSGMWVERMNAVAREIGWPEKPSSVGSYADDEEAVAWREEIRDRLVAAGPDELQAFLWTVTFSRQLNGNPDPMDGASPWEEAGAVHLADEAGHPESTIRESATHKRRHDGGTVLPEYVDTVVVHEEEADDENEDPVRTYHLLPEGADRCRCGAPLTDEHLGPGDDELDDHLPRSHTIHKACLRAFFDAEIREEPPEEEEEDTSSIPEHAEEDAYQYVRERMEEDPDVENKVLKQECEERFPDAGIDELSLRQFHAFYPLPVKRAMAQEGGS